MVSAPSSGGLGQQQTEGAGAEGCGSPVDGHATAAASPTTAESAEGLMQATEGGPARVQTAPVTAAALAHLDSLSGSQALGARVPEAGGPRPGEGVSGAGSLLSLQSDGGVPLPAYNYIPNRSASQRQQSSGHALGLPSPTSGEERCVDGGPEGLQIDAPGPAECGAAGTDRVPGQAPESEACLALCCAAAGPSGCAGATGAVRFDASAAGGPSSCGGGGVPRLNGWLLSTAEHPQVGGGCPLPLNLHPTPPHLNTVQPFLRAAPPP